jgi:indole-3-glycerol phosphate synthase
MNDDKKNILDRIVAQTHATVEEHKKARPLAVLEAMPLFSRTPLSVSQRLRAGTGNGIIAEFKRQSPSKGVINASADPVVVARAYAAHGASAISVLTDEPFFGGSLKDLLRVRDAVEIPLLRKDFIVDEYQLVEAKAFGADIILLIAACLSAAAARRLAATACDLGLEVLLELHDEEELVHLCPEVQLVGINNRSLKSFGVDLQRSMDMASKIPDSFLKVAESGIHSADQVRQFREAGFHAFLVGEHFMKQADPGEAFRQFAETI